MLRQSWLLRVVTERRKSRRQEAELTDCSGDEEEVERFARSSGFRVERDGRRIVIVEGKAHDPSDRLDGEPVGGC